MRIGPALIRPRPRGRVWRASRRPRPWVCGCACAASRRPRRWPRARGMRRGPVPGRASRPVPGGLAVAARLGRFHQHRLALGLAVAGGLVARVALFAPVAAVVVALVATILPVLTALRRTLAVAALGPIVAAVALRAAVLRGVGLTALLAVVLAVVLAALLIAALLGLTREFDLRLVQHAGVMFGVLLKVLSRDPVARQLRIARQQSVFVDDLLGGAAHLALGARAVENPVDDIAERARTVVL